MIRFGKKAAVLTAAGVLAAMSITGCSSSIDTDEVVATVGDEDITMGVANFYARMMQGQYETYYAQLMGTTGEDMWAQEVSDGVTMEESMKDSVMTTLQNMYLISQHASEYEISLTEDEQTAIEEAAQQFDADNTDEAKEAVSGYRQDIEKYLELATIQNKMIPKMQEGVNEEVSDEEAAQKAMQYLFFSYTTTDEEGNSVDLSDEEKATQKTNAQSLVDRVRGGADIETVASELGVTVNTLTFDSETTSPNTDLIAAADALENEGDVTDLIETDSGIYVGRLTSLLDREATDQEKENIISERQNEQYNSLLEEWRDATEISVNDNVWDKVNFTDQGVTITTSEEAESSEDTSSADSSSTDASADDSASADGSADTTDETAE